MLLNEGLHHYTMPLPDTCKCRHITRVQAMPNGHRLRLRHPVKTRIDILAAGSLIWVVQRPLGVGSCPMKRLLKIKGLAPASTAASRLACIIHSMLHSLPCAAGVRCIYPLFTRLFTCIFTRLIILLCLRLNHCLTEGHNVMVIRLGGPSVALGGSSVAHAEKAIVGAVCAAVGG